VNLTTTRPLTWASRDRLVEDQPEDRDQGPEDQQGDQLKEEEDQHQPPQGGQPREDQASKDQELPRDKHLDMVTGESEW
jgi:hypothetical protein